MKSKIIIFFILWIILHAFAIFNIDFSGPDEPVYFAYTSSIIEDGDLNIVNQAYPTSSQIRVTKTYNLPDFHNNGGVILWAPFYSYAKSVYYLAGKFNLKWLTVYRFDKIVKCAMSFSTVIFFFISILLTFFLSKSFFSSKITIGSILALSLGTPFFYYALFETGNANIVACLFSVLSIWFCSYAVSMKRLHWFIYGLFFAICTTVKTELWLQLVFILPFFIISFLLKKISWRNGIYFLFGLTPILVLRAINSYINYGTLHMEEMFYFFSLLRYKSTYCFNGLFDSYRGIFYTSPVFYICLLGFILLSANIIRNVKQKKLADKMQDLFLFVLASYSAVKLFFVGRIFSPGGDTLSSRVMLTEVPVFILLFAYAFRGQKKYIKYLLGMASVLFVLWNLLIISEFITGLDWTYIIGAPGIIKRAQAIKYILDFLFYPKELSIKLKLCLPLAIIVTGIIFYLRKIFTRSINSSFWRIKENHRNKLFDKFVFITVYSFVVYLVIILLNICNNRANVEKLKKTEFYKYAKVIDISSTEMSELEEDEHLWTLCEMMRYYALKGDIKRLSYIKEYKEKIFGTKESIRIHFYQPIKAYYKLGQYYNINRRYQLAIDCYKEFIKLNPYDFDAFIRLECVYSDAGDYPKAAEAFKMANQIKENYKLGQYYNINRRYQLAIDCYKEFIKLNPHEFVTFISLGYIYLTTGDYLRAAEAFELANQIKPDSMEAWFRLAEVYNKIGDNLKASGYYQKLAQFNPGFSFVYIDIAYMYFIQSDYPKAIEYLNKAIELIPDSFDAYSTLGIIYQRQSDYPKAIEYLNKAIELKADSFDVLCRLGEIYESQSNYPKAIDYFSKAVQLNPASTDTCRSLAEIYETQGDLDKAIKCYGLVLKFSFSPTVVFDVYVNLGDIYTHKSEYNKAISYLEKAMLLNPESADAYFTLGGVYKVMPDYPKAIEYFNKAIKLDPGFADVYSNLGHIYNAQDNYGKAMEYFQDFLRFNPRSADTYRVLADIYRKNQDKENMLKLIIKLRELNMGDLAKELERLIDIRGK